MAKGSSSIVSQTERVVKLLDVCSRTVHNVYCGLPVARMNQLDCDVLDLIDTVQSAYDKARMLLNSEQKVRETL